MGTSDSTDRTADRRPWWTCIATAGLALAGIVALSAIVNPLLGRYMHWDRIAVGAPVAFVLASVALRRRWL